MIQIPFEALPDLLIRLFFQYLPAIAVAIIIVSLFVVIYNYRKETESERNEKIRNIQKSRYPDFEMYLNRDIPTKKLDEES